jgi:hypothetical protein
MGVFAFRQHLWGHRDAGYKNGTSTGKTGRVGYPGVDGSLEGVLVP